LILAATLGNRLCLFLRQWENFSDEFQNTLTDRDYIVAEL